MGPCDSYNVLPCPEKIIPDPETDKLALSISQRLDSSPSSAWYKLGRSFTLVKQIMRAKEIVAMVSIYIKQSKLWIIYILTKSDDRCYICVDMMGILISK